MPEGDDLTFCEVASVQCPRQFQAPARTREGGSYEDQCNRKIDTAQMGKTDGKSLGPMGGTATAVRWWWDNRSWSTWHWRHPPATSVQRQYHQCMSPTNAVYTVWSCLHRVSDHRAADHRGLHQVLEISKERVPKMLATHHVG